MTSEQKELTLGELFARFGLPEEIPA